jgi:hypothetical protein
MRTAKKSNGVLLSLLERLSDTSYGTLFGTWMALMVCFATAYFALSYVQGDHSLTGMQALTPVHRMLEALYFSVITSTTVGYGDVAPQGFAKVFACVHSVVAFFIFAVFVSKLVSHKTDQAVDRMQRLTHENSFKHLREGFFTVRKDFDGLILLAEKSHAFTASDRNIFLIALWEVRRLAESLHDFYDEEYDLYSIDAGREKLLLEAVHRTLTRLADLIRALETEKIVWKSPAVTAEFDSFIVFVTALMTDWQTQSVFGHEEWFREILDVCKTLKD